jgi:heat shock protein 1/8
MSHISSIFDTKRLIGRKFDDPSVQADINRLPFKIYNKGGKPYIKVRYRGKDKEFVNNFELMYFH